MSTCHSPCFLPPTRLSRLFFCSLPITNFTPPKDKSPIASTISPMVAFGFSIKNFSTSSSEESKFFWIVSESFWIVLLSFKGFFWVVVSLFWIVSESFWIVLLSFKGFFWVVVSLFWIVFESFWIVLLSFKGFFWVEDSLFWVGL